MRYPSNQKAKAREAILQAGARTLRTNGFNGIGVDGIAASAGVTSGAFYSNFSNKEALLQQVIEACLGELHRNPALYRLLGIQTIDQIKRIRDRDHPEHGEGQTDEPGKCVLAEQHG